MARSRAQEINSAARSSRQLRRFYLSINVDKVFGTHRRFLAEPVGATQGGVVLLQEIFGVNEAPTLFSSGRSSASDLVLSPGAVVDGPTPTMRRYGRHQSLVVADDRSEQARANAMSQPSQRFGQVSR